MKKIYRSLIKRYSFLNHINLALKWKKREINYLLINDYKFAQKKYFQRTGKHLNLSEPKTFDEKLWYLKLNYRNPVLTICTDKYRVRNYVESKGLGHILNELYGFYESAKNIDFNTLPDKAFIKCNHTSGYNILWDRQKPFNINHFNKKFNLMLKQNYFYASREWNYKNIEPGIIVEKVLEPPNSEGFLDYRFFCFNGECKFFTIDIDTADSSGAHSGKAKRNIYDLDFNLLDFKLTRDGFDPNIVKKPDNFKDMIKYAEILSENLPFVRVDFYNINRKIIFGEMTFYHQGGTNFITPIEWDYQLGKWINIENI